jgi:hypothetical protein
MSLCSFAQITNKIIIKKIYVESNYLKLDTLPIIPFKIHIFNSKDELISDSLYKIDFKKSTLFFNTKINDTITIHYVLLENLLPYKYFHKNKSIIYNDSSINYNEKLYYYPQVINTQDINDELSKRGSISRSIRIGNNQNMSVNSTLNLQLSGKIGNDFEIIAALTDQKIPFQPSGNTQQIQEFDKVYIQIFNKKNNITIGDYELKNYDHTFLKVNRKSQGLQYIYKNENNRLLIQTSNSVSKGRYNRMVFNGIEGIQGPYKLVGANQEPFIIILAGTERIYIDGKLLTRGEDNDYIIDYNTSEIIFTAKNPITKDSRIVAEFEYSDRNYARFLTFNKIQYQDNNNYYQFQVFHEFDAKNQTLFQTLSENEKKILANAGNDDNKAIVSSINIDSIKKQNQIYYKMIDTTVNGITYDSILVYSTDSNALYYATFTYVGKNKGNYVQTTSSANGRVFKWVAPVNNIPQGEFEPIKKLIAPIKHTVIAGTINKKLSKNFTTKLDIAFSDFDKNTFSSIQNNENKGVAIKTSIIHYITNDSTKHYFSYEPFFQLITNRYKSPENFREVEFQRDWNYNQTNLYNEIMSGISWNYRFKKFINTKINNELLASGKTYNGQKHSFNIFLTPDKYDIQHNFSYLNTKQSNFSTKFIRHYSLNERKFSIFNIGIKTLYEENEWKKNSSDSLVSNSFKAFKWNTYLRNGDTSKWQGIINYSERYDYLPYEGKFKKNYKTQETSIEILSNTQKSLFVKSNLNLRNIKFNKDTSNKTEQNFISRNEIVKKIAKNSITLSTLLENTSGIEPKKQFTYVEVSPGQGTYTWIDYNHNNIKELNEFEVAKYPDQANYIRIVLPTLENIKVYSSRISQTINIRPDIIWNDKKGFKKFISYFSNQTSFQKEVKTTSNILLKKIIPIETNDTNRLLANASIRNIFSILKTNPRWGIDYIYISQKNQQLLLQGIDNYENKQNSINLRFNVNESYSINATASKGNKKFISQYFSSKNYDIASSQIDLNVYYQPDNYTRFGTGYKLSLKNNKMNIEKLKSHNINLEFNKNINLDNQINIKTELISNEFIGEKNTPIGYEMLDALQPGWNMINTIQIQRNISSKMQMVISYQARSSKGNKTIHTGSVELRAFF